MLFLSGGKEQTFLWTSVPSSPYYRIPPLKYPISHHNQEQVAIR